MHISFGDFQSLGKKQLRKFIEQCLTEDRKLDYKRTLNLKTDSEKREFAKDVTAFANRGGGLLVVGFDEPVHSKPGKFHGVNNSKKMIQQLEQTISSRCNPKIPHIHFKDIPYEKELSAIVCWIGPSEFKPHMVNDRFPIREAETTRFMEVSEVRQMILSTYERRSDIRDILEMNAQEQLKYRLPNGSGILMQAIPLIEVSEPWAIYSDGFNKALKGSSRNGLVLSDYNLMCLDAPYVGVQSICGERNRKESPWYIEVGSSGLISVIYQYPYLDPHDRPMFEPDVVGLFKAFGMLVDECLQAADKPDTSMVLTAKLLRANDIVLYPRDCICNCVNTRDSLYPTNRTESWKHMWTKKQYVN